MLYWSSSPLLFLQLFSSKKKGKDEQIWVSYIYSKITAKYLVDPDKKKGKQVKTASNQKEIGFSRRKKKF